MSKDIRITMSGGIEEIPSWVAKARGFQEHDLIFEIGNKRLSSENDVLGLLNSDLLEFINGYYYNTIIQVIDLRSKSFNGLVGIQRAMTWAERVCKNMFTEKEYDTKILCELTERRKKSYEDAFHFLCSKIHLAINFGRSGFEQFRILSIY